VVKLNFSIEDLVDSQKRAAEQNTMLKIKLLGIQKQVQLFQEQGIQLNRVIDQCKAQKEEIRAMEVELDSEKTKVVEETKKCESLKSVVTTLKKESEEIKRAHEQEIAAVRIQLSEAAAEIKRLRTVESDLRSELEAKQRMVPPSEQVLRENAALRQRVKTLEEVYCPYG
jgi:hypothetical protein